MDDIMYRQEEMPYVRYEQIMRQRRVLLTRMDRLNREAETRRPPLRSIQAPFGEDVARRRTQQILTQATRSRRNRIRHHVTGEVHDEVVLALSRSTPDYVGVHRELAVDCLIDLERLDLSPRLKTYLERLVTVCVTEALDLVMAMTDTADISQHSNTLSARRYDAERVQFDLAFVEKLREWHDIGQAPYDNLIRYINRRSRYTFYGLNVITPKEVSDT